MPVDLASQPVDVLLQLPREPRLADPGDAQDRDQAGAPLVARGVEEVLHEPELALAADERRFQPGRASLPAAVRSHALRLPEWHGLGLALERVLAGVRIGDRGLARPPRALADEHRPGLGRRLHARGRVDEVAGDHALALRADGDRRFSGDDADSHREPGRTDFAAERGDDLDQLEPGADGPLGVVLARDRRAPDRHHRVADELLDRPAVAVDNAARRVEVAREQVAHLLGIAVLGKRGEAHEVAEEHRDEPPLGLRLRASRRVRAERGAALAAEAVVRLVRGAAARARKRKRRPAARTELAASAVLDSAS